jgi:hypothetical protein
MEVIEVDADCNITYSDGTTKPCEYQPHYTFSDCLIGYGNNRGCPKWNYYHNKL